VVINISQHNLTQLLYPEGWAVMKRNEDTSVDVAKLDVAQYGLLLTIRSGQDEQNAPPQFWNYSVSLAEHSSSQTSLAINENLWL
jgi:hypothetical protein